MFDLGTCKCKPPSPKDLCGIFRLPQRRLAQKRHKQSTWKITLSLQIKYHEGLDSAMTYAPTKVRRNSFKKERLWQTLDIGNVFRPTFGLKKSQ